MRNWKIGLALYWEDCGRGKLRVVETKGLIDLCELTVTGHFKTLMASFLKVYCKLDPDISGLKGALQGSASLHLG